MRALLFTAGLGLSALVGAPAVSQYGPAGNQIPPGSATFNAEQFIGRRAPGTLRASDFMNREVYGPDDKVIGEVEDVLFDPTGRFSGLVVDVDRAPGLHERRIALPIHAFRIDPGTTATTGTVGGLPATTEAGSDARRHNRISNVVYPDRIILPIPLDGLENAPAYED